MRRGSTPLRPSASSSVTDTHDYIVLSVLRTLASFSLLVSVHAVGAQSTRGIVDRRTANWRDDYTVTLIARSGGVGHAFVALGHDDWTAGSSRVVARGFYPSVRTVAAVFGSVPGEIVDDLRSGSLARDASHLSVRVDKQRFEQVSRLMETWKDKRYSLATQNCVFFVAEVAKTIGLKAPPPAMQLPAAYVMELIALNR